MTNTIPNVPRELKPCPFCGSEARSDNGFSPAESIVYAWCSNNECALHLIDDCGFTPETWNTRTPSPAGVDGLDERMKAAGMLSAAELIAGAPLDAFMKHAGVNDLETFGQWLEMRRGECLRMQGRYDLGERDKSDDMYEWTVAHSAVFGEAHVNFKDALAGNQAIIDGLRGEVAQLQSMLATVSKAGIRVRTDRDQQAQRIGELEGLLRHAQKQVPTGSGLHMRIDAALSAGK